MLFCFRVRINRRLLRFDFQNYNCRRMGVGLVAGYWCPAYVTRGINTLYIISFYLPGYGSVWTLQLSVAKTVYKLVLSRASDVTMGSYYLACVDSMSLRIQGVGSFSISVGANKRRCGFISILSHFLHYPLIQPECVRLAAGLMWIQLTLNSYKKCRVLVRIT